MNLSVDGVKTANALMNLFPERREVSLNTSVHLVEKYTLAVSHKTECPLLAESGH